MNQHQITVMRGDSKQLTLTLVDDDGDPYDLTGVDIWFTAGDLFSRHLGDGISVDAPASGVATISIDPDDTDGASDLRRSYPYDIQLELANGAIVTPLRGLFVVTPDATTDTE